VSSKTSSTTTAGGAAGGAAAEVVGRAGFGGAKQEQSALLKFEGEKPLSILCHTPSREHSRTHYRDTYHAVFREFFQAVFRAYFHVDYRDTYRASIHEYYSSSESVMDEGPVYNNSKSSSKDAEELRRTHIGQRGARTIQCRCDRCRR
jgi:hypothetical protein